MKVRYRFRFYTDGKQKQELTRVFGSCRYVYNWALRMRTDAYFKDGRSVGYHESSSLLTALKRTPEHAWLNEISCVPTQQALRHLQTAFVNFFEKRSGYPSFKKKAGDQSGEYTRSAFKWNGRDLSLSGIGRLDVRWSREFQSEPTAVRRVRLPPPDHEPAQELEVHVRRLRRAGGDREPLENSAAHGF